MDWARTGAGRAALVILARSAVEALRALGVLAAIGALGGMTIGTLYEKRFGIAQHPVTANTVQYAAGLAATLPLAFLLEDRAVEWSLPLGLSLLYLIVCNSLIALTLLLMMIRRGEVSRVSALLWRAHSVAPRRADATTAWVGLGLPPPASPSPLAPTTCLIFEFGSTAVRDARCGSSELEAPATALAHTQRGPGVCPARNTSRTWLPRTRRRD